MELFMNLGPSALNTDGDHASMIFVC